MPIKSWPTYSVLLNLHIILFYFLIMLQREGSKEARIGFLFSANQSTDSFSLLFVKVFEITSSSYRFVFLIVELVDF